MFNGKGVLSVSSADSGVPLISHREGERESISDFQLIILLFWACNFHIALFQLLAC